MSLQEFSNGGYTVLFFYPLDFTFVCPTEIIAFSDRFEEFKSRNTQVLGVSVDSEFSHLAWIQMSRDEGGLGGLEYPLISDFHRDLAKGYGILSPEGVAYRALFIIDKQGVVQHATVNNMAFGRNVDEVIRVLDAIQYTQENPDEVCPAGWQPGDKTMRPDFDGKREYFQDEWDPMNRQHHRFKRREERDVQVPTPEKSDEERMLRMLQVHKNETQVELILVIINICLILNFFWRYQQKLMSLGSDAGST